MIFALQKIRINLVMNTYCIYKRLLIRTASNAGTSRKGRNSLLPLCREYYASTVVTL